MTDQSLAMLLVLATTLFAVGLFGVLVRRGVLLQLIALEVLLAGPALAFIAAGARRGDAQGQAMFVILLVFAAAEVAIGLALYLRLRRCADVSDSDSVSQLRS
jgi:NADH-quinone oxidoreductase subunit K